MAQKNQPADGSSSSPPGSAAQPIHVRRLIREALEAYATAEVCDEIMSDARAAAGLTTLPLHPEKLGAFIEGPLLERCRDRLGSATADAVLAQVRPLVDIVARLELGTDEVPVVIDELSPASFQPGLATRELGGKPYAVVLVVGGQLDVATALRARLPRGTAVLPCEDGSILCRDLRVLGPQGKMLIVDLRTPHDLLDAVSGEAELLAGALVMLWGATRDDAARVRAQFPAAYDILWSDADAAIEDLAAIARLGRC